MLALPVFLGACEHDINPEILTPDGNVLSVQTWVETPSTCRQRVLARGPGVPLELPPPRESGPRYRVGPGDKLHLNVFGEPGLNDLTVSIDVSGYI